MVIKDMHEDLKAIADAIEGPASKAEVPSTAGAYVLTATVADGKVTYSWESTT